MEYRGLEAGIRAWLEAIKSNDMVLYFLLSRDFQW